MKNMLILALCAGLMACATVKTPLIEPPSIVEVKIPIAIACVDVVPQMPKLHSIQNLIALNDYDLVQALHLDRLLLEMHAKELEAALTACASFKGVQ